MLLEALFVAWLSAQLDSRDCFIEGAVSSAEEQTALQVTQGCPIRIERKGKLLTMTSPKYVVEITIPDAPGTQQFRYQWGQAEATIGDQTVQISYREVGGG